MTENKENNDYDYSDMDQELNNYDGYFDPLSRTDIVSPARETVLRNFHQRDSEDMLKYYMSKIGRIKQKDRKTYDKLKELMKNSDSNLHNCKRVSKVNWIKYWELLEDSGEKFDEHGRLKKRFDYEAEIERLEQEYNHYDYWKVFNVVDSLFEPGKDNIFLGKKGTGKSMIALLLALEAVKQGNFIATNLGVKKNYSNENVKQIKWLKHLLIYMCENRMKNIENEKKGLEYKNKYVVCIIDEAENLFTAQRSQKAEVNDYNQFVQMTRKLDASMNLIFHDWASVPSIIKNSVNLTGIILKGMDENFEEIKNSESRKRVTIIFKDIKEIVKIKEIPYCDVLDSRKTSSFDIKKDNFPENSIDINVVLTIAGEHDSDIGPYKIYEYLTKQKVNSMNNESLYQEIKFIDEKNKNIMDACDKKVQYFTFIKSKFEEEYGIIAIEQYARVKSIIQKVVDESWDFDSVQKNLKKMELNNIDWRNSTMENIKLFLEQNPNKFLKAKIGKDRRSYDMKEITDLHNGGVSKSKLIILYGHRNEINAIESKV